jgi:hypothetical protein
MTATLTKTNADRVREYAAIFGLDPDPALFELDVLAAFTLIDAVVTAQARLGTRPEVVSVIKL